MPFGPHEITLRLTTPGSPAGTIRRKEPLTVGVPLPTGLLRDDHDCTALHSTLGILPLQTAVLDRWPDGSIRWMLVDMEADIVPGATVSLRARPASPEKQSLPLLARAVGDGVEVQTGVATFVIARDRFPFSVASVNGRTALDVGRTAFLVIGRDGQQLEPQVTRVDLESNGPLRAVVRVQGTIGRTPSEALRMVARMHFGAGHAAVRFDLTLRNPRRARHKGGFWELGDPGSIHIRHASIGFALPAGHEPGVVGCSEKPGEELRHYQPPFELHQHSSGGENWQSPVHLDRSGALPFSLAGYRLTAKDVTASGSRATPVVEVAAGPHQIALAVERFWENFPKAIRVADGILTLRLFPGQPEGTHEIQGGEQKTHTFWLSLARDSVSDLPLDWVRNPSRAIVSPQWCSGSDAIPFLTPREQDPHTEYLALVDSAIEGADSFVQKREVADEYGWRHFGEIWADHEAVFHKGPAPLVSHYNNQYDAVGGLIHQYLRSGNPSWWPLLDDLARHVVDIDVYHTDDDWAKYNHGLFWHTVHYKDAGRSTHRSYPHAPGVNGGGPSCGHLYTTGLMHHYFLTGSPESREAVVQLATFVIDSDDGRQSIFRWLDRGSTGYASESGSPDYHGPGRAPANALNALVDAHRLTGEARFLEKAEALVRRCVHPDDDINARNLLDAEHRWFYTMFLQSLGKFLHHKRELSQIDTMYAYGQASLLRYARWMADHERPYLDHPEGLEFPTETWAAQDMRKSEVFKWAALHATVDEGDRFLERGQFFFDYAVRTLSSMPTRTLARPVVLLLAYGWAHAAFAHGIPYHAPSAIVEAGFGKPTVFVPQKPRAMRKARFAAAGLALAGLAVLFLLVRWVS